MAFDGMTSCHDNERGGRSRSHKNRIQLTNPRISPSRWFLELTWMKALPLFMDSRSEGGTLYNTPLACNDTTQHSYAFKTITKMFSNDMRFKRTSASRRQKCRWTLTNSRQQRRLCSHLPIRFTKFLWTSFRTCVTTTLSPWISPISANTWLTLSPGDPDSSSSNPTTETW